jgi:methyl-accepting chemotaxis protein PixJ
MNFDKSPQEISAFGISKTLIHEPTPTATNRIQSFLQQNLIGTMIISTCLNLGLTGAATWAFVQTSQQLEATLVKQNRQQNLSDRLTYLDEVLTMSAQMFATTGKPGWEKRYQDNAPEIDKTLAELTKDVPLSQQVDTANKKLLGLEDRAFKLAKQAKIADATALLSSSEYQQNKQTYATGVSDTIAKIRTTAELRIKADRQTLSNTILLELISLGLFITTASLVVTSTRNYIRDREKTQRSLQKVQLDLLDLNEQLQQEDQMRSLQQDRIAQESNQLETDIDRILDVVNSLEQGNLTVEAETNRRSTGPIADTLNRLIESLHQIIAVVVSSADRVVTSADGLEQLAVETASQAQSQTRSIQQIEILIAEVNSLSTNSHAQALATTDAVQLAKAAVGNGYIEMGAMADGIESLQQGTEQIVRRVERLNEFVALAAQFSKDRKRVAALTKVLALNASLLSKRALKEQDPTQFASLAHEFETIADRVNELSEDNNTSFISLQHRTDQIQTVTSGLNQDIADINQLVKKFTAEMGKSRQAFTNIQLVTEQVAIVGEQVSTSSQDIIRAVNETLTAIKSIGIIAENTEQKATITREQIQSMGTLAQNLLHRVEFFQLNDEALTIATKFSPPADSTFVKNPEAIYALLQPRT